MNSKQRRKVYRSMPRPGTVIHWKRRNGSTARGIVVGLVPPGPPAQWNGERARVPNVHRVAVETGSYGAAHVKVTAIISRRKSAAAQDHTGSAR